MHRSVAVALLAALLVLAGCAAPTAHHASGGVEGPGGADIAERGLDVREGSLSVDGNETFERVQTLLGTDLDPPAVYVDESLVTGTAGVRHPSSFEATVGLPQPNATDVGDELTVGGIASSFRAVYIIPSAASSEAEVEQVLAHELVHAGQFQRGVPQRLHAEIPVDHRTTTDGQLAMRSLLEGAAVYGSSAYTETYDVPIRAEGEIVGEYFANASSGTRFAWGPYYHGYRFIDANADSPADHWSVYEEPPATMRDVLSGDSAGDLDPFDATLEAEAGEWTRVGADTKGEFVLRTVLESHRPAAESAEAAAGWEYDRTLRVAGADVDLDGHAWTVRFVDEANASAFESTLAAYLDGRADRVDPARSAEGAGGAADDANAPTNATWVAEEHESIEPYAFEVEAVDDRTVALLAGPDAFVEAAAVEPATGAAVASDGGHVRLVIDGTAEGEDAAGS